MIEHPKKKNAVIRMFATEKSWIEGEALGQLHRSAELKGMCFVVGLPDLHAGSGTPIGAAFFNEDLLFPHIIGNDVGCGIGVWRTTLKTNKIKRDKWAGKLRDLEEPWNGNIHNWLIENGLVSDSYDLAQGTLGGSNHFAELQRIDHIYDPAAAETLHLDRKYLYLLVHSGSRGLGADLLRHHLEKWGPGGLMQDTAAAVDYMASHDYAVQWAAANRSLIAKRFVALLNGGCEKILDMAHNFIEKMEYNGEGWLHRKGAVPSNRGPVVIPGSRGALSYLVMPVGDQVDNLWSLAHGAGRKWPRKNCKALIQSRFRADALTHTPLGSVVICEDKAMLFQDAPQAYKKIEHVISDMQHWGLIRVIATLKPVITYKMRKSR